MARSKSTTTTPKAKKVTVPQSAPAKQAVLTTRSSSPEISDADLAPVAAEAITPARKQAKRKAPIADEDNNFTPINHSSKKSKVTMHTEQTTMTSTTASGKKSTHKHRNVHIEIPVASTPKGKHIVFNDDENDQQDGDDGPSEFFTPQEDVKKKGLEAQLLPAGGEEEEKHSDDDDEAPEAVSTSTAAAQAAKASQAAARVVELQEDDVRRKRQERDAKFKKQAEARKLQQQKSAATAAPAQAAEDEEDSDDEPTAAKEQPASRLVTSLSTSSRKRLDRRALPSVLPDEFLESDSEAEEEDGEEESTRPKKITFNTAARQVARAEPRHPADLRVGSTVYRVMKKQGESKLAPRGGKYSKNAREMMLGRGRTVPRTSVKRKGFLVKS